MQFQARADRAMAMAEAKSRGTAAELSEMWAYGRRETAAPGRIEAAIARARAAGVAGLEAYDAAWVAKSLRQGECHDVVEAFVESEEVGASAARGCWWRAAAKKRPSKTRVWRKT